jgi:hypothetical protein
MAFVPFNYDPSTGPVVKTSSTTVPAGKYAWVSALIPDMQIDAVKIYLLKSQTAGPSAIGTASGIAIGSVTRGDYVAFSATAAGGDSFAVKYVGALTSTLFTLTGSTSYSQTFFVQSDALTIDHTVAGTGFYNFDIYRINNAGIWVSEGQVINGTKYLYTEYTRLT